MARIPYLPADLSEPQAVVEAIRRRRGGELLNLDRLLLHSPPLAQGWNQFMGAVRRELSLPARLRELWPSLLHRPVTLILPLRRRPPSPIMEP